MGNYFDLIAAINAAIKTNGEQGITGASLNAILRDMVAALGAGYQYVGVVAPDAAAPSTDYNAVYLGLTAGTYTNFGGTQVRDGQFGVFTFNGSWTYNVADIASGGYVRYDAAQVMTQEQAAQARSNIAAASNADVNAKYTKPDSGIPATDLAQAVQTSLGKADVALPASDVVDNLTTEDATRALSAKQGKVLDNEVSRLGQKVDDKLDAPEETNIEYLRVYVDSERKVLFAITSDGKVLLNGGVGLTNIDYTAEDKLVVRATRHIENPEWLKLVTDSNGTILYGVKADGKLSGDGEKSLSTNDYTNKDKNVVSRFDIIEHPEFSLLIAQNGVPLFGLKRDGTLYPNVVGGLEALKKDVLKHRVHFDEPIEETFVLPDSYNNVIATMYSYILEEIIVENTPYFHFSKDLGKTWVTVPNTIGDITHAHIFSDGTFLLCGRRKAYHTKDFETITESTLYDADGSLISELSRDSFFTLGHHDVYNVVDGKEIEIWGEYVLDRNQNPKIWYTIDNGVTLRSAFTFGVSEIDGSVVDCRHIHKVTYCKKDNTFYATTGDAYSSNEDHVLAGNINVNNNTWEWRHIADGRMFKFGIPFFDDVFMYAITDYTEAALYDQKGLLYTPISGIEQINSDIAKFNYAYRFPVDEALTDTGLVMAPFDMVIDGGENKILFGDYQASGFLWFANKGYGFKRYRLSKKMLLGLNIIGPNFNGDIYTQAFGDGVTYTNEYFKLNRGRGYNLTEIFRSNGIEDFMKQLNTKYNF